MLLDTKLTAVTEYFVKNWDPIKHQWVTAYKDLYFNLGETTNNRLKSMFNKLKSVCTKHTSMMQFFIEFFIFLGAIRNDRNHHHLMSLTRHEIAIPSHPDMILYREHLTPYAFSFVISQFEKIKNDSSFNFEKSDEIGNYNIKHSKFLIASKEFCNCRFMSKMELPCYHLFQLRKFLMLPMFDVQLVNRRWTKEYYNQSLRARNDTNITSSVEIVSEVDVKPVKTLTQAQKYRNLLKTCQLLASVGSEGGMVIFKKRQAQLEVILRQWQKGEEVTLVTNDNIIEVDNVDLMEFDCHVTITGIEKIKSSPISTNKHIDSIETFPLLSEKDVPQNPAKLDLKEVLMPPKMKNKGRPKRANTTVIGVPKKKNYLKPIPYIKLLPKDKDRFILTRIVQVPAVELALSGGKLICSSDIKKSVFLPDSLRDEKSLDIERVEMFFKPAAWKVVKSAIISKKKQQWICSICRNILKDEEESISCDCSLLWSQLKCSTLRKTPKTKYWFCNSCRLESTC
ncbi:uncharacterized protein LOC124808018 [Hydra vulgaris]|uniref:uncharacterized protein LOC124808018 n=1 Tax=Hydra vulgaris TaxID=6087 RepID=UPI001F5F9C1A|nr:uncharacterized protein LOC124808018 [Hydra vulgaris]